MGKKINLNLDWRFHLGDEPTMAPQTSPDFMGYDDSAWRVVTLPHDWSVEHPFDRKNASGTGYLPGGTAWYRKHFTLPEDVSGRQPGSGNLRGRRRCQGWPPPGRPAWDCRGLR